MVTTRSDQPISASASASTSPSPLAPAADGLLSPSRLVTSPRFPLPSLSQSNTSSVSLVPSTAQGRPIPLSDAHAADRTTALRALSRSQPTAGHPHSKTSGPPPSTTGTTTGTYSQPVLVRTYSGPISSSTQPRSESRRDAISGVQGRPSAPSSSDTHHRRHGFPVTLIRPLVSRKPSLGDDAKLPPLEAFSFKSIMAEMEQDIGADLDRIADICARSRYSLSNQYEVHVAPHGSGAGFARGSQAERSIDSPSKNSSGPTLQAISIDDDHSGANPGRRILVRRRSAAYGTLETIISSSRSSDEDRSKRKSAAEIAAEVRGRVPHSSPGGSGNADSSKALVSSELQGEHMKRSHKARPTLAGAILDHSRAQNCLLPEPQPPRTSSTNLVSKPAIPETSHNYLVNTTTYADGGIGPSVKEQVSVSVSGSVATAAMAIPEEPKDHAGLLGGFRFSIPWKGTFTTEGSSTEQKPTRTKSYAEGTLRQILKTAESGNRGDKPADGEGGEAG
ncbi:hypothetical protein GGR55DRAFT_108842 [Xylaria sp. FL0064]|nr:hypothetical protein GGR55DRAFT_108842 [Xylaria sp. FL0064]